MPFLLLLSASAISSTGDGLIFLMKPLTLMTALLVMAGGLAQKAGVVLGGNSLRPMRRGDNYFHQRGANCE